MYILHSKKSIQKACVGLEMEVEEILYFILLYSLTFIYIFLFFSLIVDLQCSVNFFCIAKWPSHICVWLSFSFSHIILFLTLSSIMFHHKWLGRVPCAMQQDLIAYPLQMQWFASTIPQLPVHPTLSASPLATTSLFSKSMRLFLFCR